MRFVTAAYGAEYVRAARALRRSFDVAMPDAELLIYSDDATVASLACQITMQEALKDTRPFNPAGGRRCTVFSFGLLQRQHKLHGTDACWIDADMVVLGDFRHHFRLGVPNLMCHGRRSSRRLPITGMYSMPPGPIVSALIKMTQRRADRNPSGDQFVVQRWAQNKPDAHWLTDDTRYIYNLELGTELHPYVGDPRLKKIKPAGDGRWMLDDRQVMVLCFTSWRLREHLADDFCSFTPSLTRLLRQFYKEGPQCSPCNVS